LEAGERAVVERAAVIGKQFYRGAVAELLAPPARSAIDGNLEALRRKEMVEPEGIYWIDEPVYRFHHILIRDAAYRLLLKEARAALHERFADWLAEKAGELVGEFEEVIAFHLEQAHGYLRELAPTRSLDERGRALGARAAERLGSAGRRALAREDLAAAANLLRRALACEAGPEEELLWDLAEVVLSAGDAAAAAEVVERYAAAAAGDARGQARTVVLRAQLANLTSDADPAATVAAVQAAAVRLGELEDPAGAAKAWGVAALCNSRLGQVGAVEATLDRALTAARAAEDRRRTTAVLAAAPRAALWGPSPVTRASGRCLDVVRILRMTAGNRHLEAMALRCQAVLEAMRGRFDAAREILAGGRATLEELGLSLELSETVSTRVWSNWWRATRRPPCGSCEWRSTGSSRWGPTRRRRTRRRCCRVRWSHLEGPMRRRWPSARSPRSTGVRTCARRSSSPPPAARRWRRRGRQRRRSRARAARSSWRLPPTRWRTRPMRRCRWRRCWLRLGETMMPGRRRAKRLRSTRPRRTRSGRSERRG
jgi:hypothetical protein